MLATLIHIFTSSTEPTKAQPRSIDIKEIVHTTMTLFAYVLMFAYVLYAFGSIIDGH